MNDRTQSSANPPFRARAIPGCDYRRAFSLERRANGAIRLRGLCLIYRRRFIIATP